MIDIRPIGYVIGLLLVILGAAMLLPMIMDIYDQNGHWPAFVQSAVLTVLCGGLMALACSNAVGEGLSIRQTFLLTTAVWLMLPIFGALPFWFGETEARFVDAVFESMSGLTTTGATVFGHLETLPSGLLLWRALLQWMGGIGVIVVAMVFLPELRVGGMQIFRSEGFDTLGKILPRAGEIASRVSVIYIGLTAACALTYLALGMAPFDALTHSMTTLATGGFANYDGSFGVFPAGIEYAGVFFMLLAALPFVRYVQMMGGSAQPLLRDSQVRLFFGIVATFVLMITIWQMVQSGRGGEAAFRKSLFNVTSIMTGTGYASENYMVWGSFPVTIIFFLGLIGGCAGSTACSIKVFRYQLLFASIRAQVRAIHSPSGLFTARYEGRPVGDDVLSSVTSFFVMFIVSLGALAVLLGTTGLDFTTSVSGAAAALGNIGPGLGHLIGPAGSFAPLNDAAKWMLSAGMLIGRLELLVVYALFTVGFWRD
ncbi:TrkH family potassium uptake protein [Alphaproteobacteria bacterium KMM 3653]|uniref:Trk system potassium uptake protein n=1 Tax=Harenicola maris TaxID=2841044 RepID=A0AAP2CUM3_9RHOB|nr:TrkH family potassium uptake protein [Harenicola maris]